jgi:hypothetical protein
MRQNLLSMTPTQLKLRELQLEREKWKRECRNNLTAWCIEALRPLGLKPARHHLFLIDELKRVARGETQRLMIFMPPNHAKTIRAAESDLQADGENGAVAQARERVLWRRVENFPGLRFRERRRASLVAIDRRPLHLHDGITVRRPVSHQMLEQAGQGRQATAHCRSGGAFLLALHPYPGDDGAVIDLAQRVRGRDPQGAHEVLHVEPVGAAGLRAFLLRQPDVFFGAGELAGTGRVAVFMSSALCGASSRRRTRCGWSLWR